MSIRISTWWCREPTKGDYCTRIDELFALHSLGRLDDYWIGNLEGLENVLHATALSSTDHFFRKRLFRARRARADWHIFIFTIRLSVDVLIDGGLLFRIMISRRSLLLFSSSSSCFLSGSYSHQLFVI